MAHRLASFIAVLATLFVLPAGAADLKVISAGAVRGLIAQIIEDYSLKTGQKFDFTIGTTGQLRTVITSGQPADLIIVSVPLMGELEKTGKLMPGSRAELGRVGIGVAVRDGASVPDVATPDALKKALLNAKSIGHSIGPSGEHFSKVIIVRLGIADQLKTKITVVRGMPVAAAVAKGDVEIGIHQIAELMPIAGIDIVGDLPAELNTTIVYGTGLTTMVKQPDAAKELVKYLSLQSSVPVIKKNGMDPA